MIFLREKRRSLDLLWLKENSVSLNTCSKLSNIDFEMTQRMRYKYPGLSSSSLNKLSNNDLTDIIDHNGNGGPRLHTSHQRVDSS